MKDKKYFNVKLKRKDGTPMWCSFDKRDVIASYYNYKANERWANEKEGTNNDILFIRYIRNKLERLSETVNIGFSFNMI